MFTLVIGHRYKPEMQRKTHVFRCKKKKKTTTNCQGDSLQITVVVMNRLAFEIKPLSCGLDLIYILNPPLHVMSPTAALILKT